MVRLFTVELEHYEKIEGVPLSLDGKANKLASDGPRATSARPCRGFAVVPLFAGYDVEPPTRRKAGRIVTYDVTGGRYDESLGYHAVGSGSVFAKSALKKLHDASADLATAVRTAIEALYDAADDDTATGGPDLDPPHLPDRRQHHRRRGCGAPIPTTEIEAVVREVVAGRTENPGG